MSTVDDAVRRNREALSRFLATVDRLSPSEWQEAVAPGKWSPGQIAEHLALTMDIARQVLHGTSPIRTLPAPVRPLLRWIVLRSVRKGQFPRGGRAVKAFIPGDGAGDRDKVLARLTTAATAFEAEYSAAANGGRSTLVHPAFGTIALVDYMLFNDLHIRHHTAQIPAPRIA